MKMKRKVSLLLCPVCMSLMAGPIGFPARADALQPVLVEEKPLRLWYNKSAPNSDEGWEQNSLPLGCGYFGANVFGGVETERIQITENSLWNVNNPEAGVNGLTNFVETYLDFGHSWDGVSNYSRDLVLNDAVAHVSYDYEGVTYSREYFTSYPDAVLALKLSASESGSLSFTLRPEIPFLSSLRTGKITVSEDLLTIDGHINGYEIDYEGQFKVIPVGSSATLTPSSGSITVQGADSAFIFITVGTNYQLSEQVFSAADSEKLNGFSHPHEKLTQRIDDAVQKGYDTLLSRHKEDYQKYFGRVHVDLGGQPSAKTTDQLLSDYKTGTTDPYLEELYFQYGRYLLISSSRTGALPPNLQGVWNVHESAPWSGGYWHNINIQMNYWPVFSTNLAEMFESYIDYHQSYLPTAQKNASDVIRQYHPDHYSQDGNNGWSVGTGATPYSVYAANGTGTDGNATGALMSAAFWDYYAFTQNKEVLQEVYPSILGNANFMYRVMEPFGDLWLADPSASPEQMSNDDPSKYYVTVGTAWDQQLAYESHKQALQAAEVLGLRDDELLSGIRKQIHCLDPVVIGASGQVKEFREEEYYGEIGEKTHRHISQLIGLYPGTLINHTTPAWLDAAKTTLNLRGDESTGWAMAHRLNLWARTGDGERAYKIYQTLLRNGTLDNLWDTHPPFQIDGNFGGTAGFAEMLLQSHEGYIAPLAARPKAWASGSYSGLMARGNFEVSAKWSNNQAEQFDILSNSGGVCNIYYPNISNSVVLNSAGDIVSVEKKGTDLIAFSTTAGQTYMITQIPDYLPTVAPEDFQAKTDDFETAELSWTQSADALYYNLYKAVGDASDYTLIASDIDGLSYRYEIPAEEQGIQTMYRVTAVAANGRESDGAVALIESAEPDTPQKAVGSFLGDRKLQVEITPVEGADSYVIYEKIGEQYEAVFSSSYPYAIINGADPAHTYGISAKLKDWESEIVELVMQSDKTYSENLLLNKPITSEISAQIEFPLSNAVDGDLTTRYAMPDNINGEYSVIIDLEGGCLLDELQILEFWDEKTRSGQTSVEVFYNGVWTTIIDNQPLNMPGTPTTFDLGDACASLLRITFKNTTGTNSASIYEIQCSGTPFKGLGEENNILEGNQTAKASVSVQTEFPLSNAFDNDRQTRWAVSDSNDTYTVTLDLGDTYTLDILTFHEFNAYDGYGSRSQETTIEVYQDGKWLPVVEKAPLNDPMINPITTFALGLCEASQLRFTFHNPYGTNAASFYEITCSSIHAGVVSKEALYSAVLLANSVDQTTISPEQSAQLADAVNKAIKVFSAQTTQDVVDRLTNEIHALISGMSTELPQAPFAKEIQISGDLTEDSPLRVSYAYYDPNGDTQDKAGTKYRWQYSKNGVSDWITIEGADSEEYVLTHLVVGKYVRALVQVASDTEPKIGPYSPSNVVGPIAVNPNYRNQNFHTISLGKTKSVYSLTDDGTQIQVMGISDKGEYDITGLSRLSYSSSDPYVVAVSSSGMLIPKHKTGYAFITATVTNPDGTQASAKMIVSIYGTQAQIQDFENYNIDFENNPHIKLTDDPCRTGDRSIALSNRPDGISGTEAMWSGLDLYGPAPDIPNMIGEGWFYDNGENTNADARIFFQTPGDLPATAQYHVGIITGLSLDHYCIDSNAASRSEVGSGYLGAGTVYHALDGTDGYAKIPRSKGWHQVTIITTGNIEDQYTEQGLVSIYIDGQLAFAEHYVHPSIGVVRAKYSGNYELYYDDLALFVNEQKERPVTAEVSRLKVQDGIVTATILLSNQTAGTITGDLIPILIEDGRSVRGEIQHDITMESGQSYQEISIRISVGELQNPRLKLLFWKDIATMTPFDGRIYYPKEIDIPATA